MKVTYGICQLHYAVISSGVYQTPKPMPGGVSLSIDPPTGAKYISSGIGNVPYGNTEGEYSGNLVIASLPLAFLTDIYGYEVNQTNDVIKDKGRSGIVHFALLFQTEIDNGAKRVVFYDCEAGSYSEQIRTTEAGINYTAYTVPIKMRKNPAKVLRGYDSDYKAEVFDTNAAYETFFNSVYGA